MIRSADKVQRVMSDSILAAFPARIIAPLADCEIPSRFEKLHPTDVTMEGVIKEFKMSATLKLSVPEYEQMIARGAFADLDRKIEFILHDQHSTVSPAVHPSLQLSLSDLFLKD
ncbi:hypothetical protein Enr13x_00730 [Stieleria neptunia]|uniref:Uncharacterized protein n=1 Tax=Stieleria neptunia TaxID=2527979 RepID=A0A518HHG7_9BACT|nr:hypothetical protein [Stieleria neptunia]QDV40267.1 hypothetical protein Enr13x_00730 [Stieleria neptunia]